MRCILKICGFFYNIWLVVREAFRLILFTPVDADFPPARVLKDDEQQTANQIKDLYSAKGDGQIIVLFGPWGSGKSTLISSMIAANMKPFDSSMQHRVSMHIASNVNEAFLCLIPVWVKVTTLILALACLGFADLYYFVIDSLIKSVSGSPTAVAVFTVITAIFIIINAHRSFYILCGILESIISSLAGFQQIKIIEDFDRSSLEKDNILACLASRVRTNSTYVVLIGYNSIDEQLEYLDIMKKLDAKIISLEVNPDNLLKAAQNLDANIKFKDSRWLRSFTYREVVSIVDTSRKLVYEWEARMIRYAYYRTFFYFILRKFKVSEYDISFSNGAISNSKITNIDAYRVLRDFVSSLDVQDIKNESGFTHGASNWADILLRELLFAEGTFRDVQRLHY